MGGCQSTDYTILPKQKLEIKENKFEQIIKYKFIIPQKLRNKLQIHTSNGKITDYITKNQTPCKITYQEIQIDKMLSNDNKFIDQEFKNNNQSIGKNKQIIENIQWKRPQQFMKQNYKIFQSSIEPLDIKQGKLGNCYFLSAITAISQYPFIVKRIFQSTETSSYGFYGIWLFIDGLWKCIVIDDYFPLNANRPIYSRNHGNQLWVMILQKAYAKVFGSYIAIESGLTGIAMNALTGAPYQYLCKNSNNHIETDLAWQFLTQHISKNHLLTGSSQNNDRNGYLGLISTHAYTIIDIKQIHLSTKQGRKKQRILKLSNPWGKYEWKGRWSQYSDIWNQQLRQQLKFEKKDDGLFWIGLDDFCQNFGQICVCKYNKNYISTSLSLEFSKQTTNNYKGIFIHTSNRNCGYLSLIQQDHRFYPQTNYQYSLVRIIIMQIDKTTQTITRYINDMIDCDHDATIQLQLQPGDYYVIIQIDWKNKFTRNTVLNYYGQHPISIIEDLVTFNIQDIFNQIVLLHQKYTQQQRIYQYAKDTKIVRITGSIAGYVYYHYTNNSTYNNYVCQTVSLKEYKFIKVHAQLKDNQFTVKVYPNQKRIVLLKVQKQGNGFYSFATKIQFYILQKYSIEKLKELADRKPTKVKKRQIEGKQIDVRVKTYNYSGGIVLLYQNRMDKYAYVEQITFQLENLTLENQQLNHNRKLQIDLEPQSEKILSFVVSSPGNQVIFRTKMSFYLNSPEFKF